MATIKRPQGRMTKPLATPFEVGDVVVLRALLETREDVPPADPVAAAREAEIVRILNFALYLHGVSEDRRPKPRVGDVGVIRRIYVSDPNDGDDTWLMHDVKWTRIGRIYPVGADEIDLKSKPPAGEADAWLRRQLATLSAEGV